MTGCERSSVACSSFALRILDRSTIRSRSSPSGAGKPFTCACVRYRTGKRRPEGDFVVRSARLTMTGFGRFELAYFRHTERWFTVYRGLTATECFHEIESNEIFWPVM